MNTYTFDPHLNLRQIVLVGLGGTGSQLARSLARMVYDMQARRLSVPVLRFVDPDVVEMKNVGRQMFTVADVGQNKAEVLARRFSAALGIKIIANAEHFDPDKHTKHNSYGYYYRLESALIVGAVDNHEARKALASADGYTWIDCGNHFSSGQVIIGNKSQTKDLLVSMRSAKDGELRWLPNAAALFPSLLDPEPVSAAPAQSCADLVQFGEQHLLINDLVAQVGAGYVYKLLHRQPIKSFITYVDLDGLSMRSLPICPDELEVYL